LINRLIRRTRYVELISLFVASAAIWWSPVAKTIGLALNSDAHTHILLVLPLTVALIYFDSRNTLWNPQPNMGLGLALLTVGVLIRVMATLGASDVAPDIRLSVSIFGLVVFWIGSVLLLFGLVTVKKFLYPLCLLLLVVPLPDAAVGVVTRFLQTQSAIAVEVLLRLARVPVAREGVLLSLPGLDIEVASECSSIRSSLMLVITTLVLAHLFLDTWWKKALLVAATVPLAVAKNAVRIFTIVELGTRVDPGYLNGRLHRNGGILFFGLAVGAIAALLWLLRHKQSPGLSTRSQTGESDRPR
jgi:exosortase